MKKKNIDFKVGEIVVYPKHGVGEIMRIESMKLSNIKSKEYGASYFAMSLDRSIQALIYIIF